ncbi:plasmid recombination protein [Eubacterium ventriosum]|uniref:plasmid recombination protein n=1 Tax=Eubacterium ventriosum TaxID=39496 RepID=UPI003999C289
MVGKGSYSHNRRSFVAKNVDENRIDRNVVFKDEKIKNVYHELFDEAQQRYNDKQKRKDRKIDNYYEKIRTSKQEKLYHEIIVQVGNKDDTNARSYEGVVAKNILKDYMKDFEKRNPNLRVFEAYLHMDEETPHLHIDFIPFVTGSKRGMDTRVSLKAALDAQGFRGNSRGNIEWKRWVESEKEELAKVMANHKINWLKKGTHEKHLSVLDFEKRERAKEVKQLEEQIKEKDDEIVRKKRWIDLQLQTDKIIRESIEEKREELKCVRSELEDEKAEKEKIQKETDGLRQKKREIEIDVIGLMEERSEVQKDYSEYARMSKSLDEVVEQYESGWQYRLQEPERLMSTKNYKEKYVEPLLVRLKRLLKSLLDMLRGLQYRVMRAERENVELKERIEDKDMMIEYQGREIERLEEIEEKYDAVVEELGEEVVERIVGRNQELEREKQHYLERR